MKPKQPKEHLPTGEARKRQLAEQRAEEERWAAEFHRTPRCRLTLSEGHSDDGQGYGNRDPEQGARSLFKQIVSGNAVVGVIR